MSEQGESGQLAGAVRAWGTTNQEPPDPERKKLLRRGVSEALLVVARIRSRIPSWQRSLTAAATEAGATTPNWTKLGELLDYATGGGPRDAAKEFEDKDAASKGESNDELRQLSTQELLGDHGQLLVQRLDEAQTSWDRANRAVDAQNRTDTTAHIQAAQTALNGAMQHALFLTFLGDLLHAHIGERRVIGDYCQDWGLTAAQIDTLWLWLTTDPLKFGGENLPVAVDTQNRCAYRKAEGSAKVFFAAATVWGGTVVYGAVVGLFALLDWAGVTSWPREQWGWKMLVLLLFVAIGAGAHLGSRILNINYDNPIKVYDAGNIIDWLSLRWVGVLQMYIPVAVVVGSLWGAGNVPTSFQKLGTAILAGYTADSLLGAAVSKLHGQTGAKQSSSPPTAQSASSPTAASATSSGG
jgi:hypothetical protein